MNMKRIVFAAGGILVMLVIIFFTLHSITHIDEINQKRRDKNKGEEMASRIITTTATTSIWDAIRQAAETESESDSPSADENGENIQETQAVNEENTDFRTQDTSVPQTYTETVILPVS